MFESFTDQELKLMRLVIRGAYETFEDEGADIAEILEAQKKPYLITAFDTIGTALRWLRGQVNEAITARESA